MGNPPRRPRTPYTKEKKMGRPINKKFFGADAGQNDIKVQFHNGTSSVPGYIVKQKGSKRFVVKAFGNATTYVCKLVDKASASLLEGEMTITVKFDNTTVDQVTKINGRTVTAGGVRRPWNFSTSTTDSAVQVEEAGSNVNVQTGSTNLEGDAA